MSLLKFTFLMIFIASSNESDINSETNSKEKRLALPTGCDFRQEFERVHASLAQQQEEIQNLTAKLSEKVLELDNMKAAMTILQKAQGSTYTRWGKASCPNSPAELVYKGYTATSPYTTTGGSVTFLCLSEEPQWDHYDERTSSEAKIASVEYEFYSFRNQDGASQFFGRNIYNDDAPCAVCHINRAANIMIPGRTDCYDGWTKEYSGYIVGMLDMASHPSEWICLDRRPDVIPGGKSNDNQGLLYMVEAKCGGNLECPPYVQGREITCVVCSK